jgi:predicted acyl esterase
MSRLACEQIAALRPAGLAGVISLYSTDDRYADDVHYMGGCVMADQMLSWASIMFAWNARPPCTTLQQWRQRLHAASTPWVHTWLAHQV